MIEDEREQLPPGLEYIDSHTIRKREVCFGEETFHFMERLCKHLIAHPDPLIVPVYAFQREPSITYWKTYGKYDIGYAYYYDMMRLHHISEMEKQIIWQVAYAKIRGIQHPTREFSERPVYIYKTIIPIEQAWEQFPRLMTYLGEVVQVNRYHDLHGENVMLDHDAGYRLIDLEGFKNPPLSRPSNGWLMEKQ